MACQFLMSMVLYAPMDFRLTDDQLLQLSELMQLLSDQKNASKVAIFDSGIGGLTVLPSLIADHQVFDIHYRGDTAHFPYGEKSGEELVPILIADLQWAVATGAARIGIACNTASVIWRECVEQLPQSIAAQSRQLVFDTISAAMRALLTLNLQKQHSVIGVIGTELTVASGCYERAIHQTLPDSRPLVLQSARQELVSAIEHGNHEAITQELLRIGHFFKVEPPSVLILGCTHYSHVEHQLEELFPDSVILDPSQALGHQLRDAFHTADQVMSSISSFISIDFTGSDPYIPQGLRWLDRYL